MRVFRVAGGAQQAPSRAASLTSWPGPASPPGGQQLPSRPQKCPGDQNLAVDLARRTRATLPSHAAERGPRCHASLGTTHSSLTASCTDRGEPQDTEDQIRTRLQGRLRKGTHCGLVLPEAAPGARGQACPWQPISLSDVPTRLPLHGTSSSPFPVESHILEKCLKRNGSNAAPGRSGCEEYCFSSSKRVSYNYIAFDC